MAYTKLEIIFTPKSFRIDDVNKNNFNDSDKVRRKNFLADKFQAFYELSFDNNYKSESPTFGFLHFLSEKFLEIVTSLPEIEFQAKI